MTCENCNINRAIIVRPKDKSKVCKNCFYDLFELDIHNTVTCTNMFEPGSTIGIGISGGKDSTVLAYVLNKLNKKFGYNLQLVLLCVDEGIKGYRDYSIDTVHENSKDLNLNLKIVSFKDMYGYSMDEVVSKVGYKNNCTYCGVFRRQSLEEAARSMNVDCLVTGHNANDIAETVILNLVRGDHNRLKRCTLAITNKSKACDGSILALPRAKPFKYSYQKEIVLYAFHKKLKYFSTECTYSPEASRGYVRNFLYEIEKIDPAIILRIIQSGDTICTVLQDITVHPCSKCRHPTASQNSLCKGCLLLGTLSK